MRKIIVFNQVTLDGYFVDMNDDMSWAHKNDAEWNAFVAENARGDATLLFGRISYELMSGFWPTPHAIESMPTVAEGMNRMPKVVFSRTLDQASWNKLFTDISPADLSKYGRPFPLSPYFKEIVEGYERVVLK